MEKIVPLASNECFPRRGHRVVGAFREMVRKGTYFEDARYIDEDAAQRAIYNTLVSLHKRIVEAKL